MKDATKLTGMHAVLKIGGIIIDLPIEVTNAESELTKKYKKKLQKRINNDVKK